MIHTTRQVQPEPKRRSSIVAYDGLLDTLPAKTRNALLQAGITSLAQADALSDNALQRIKWIGAETVALIRSLAHHAPTVHTPIESREREDLRRHAAAIAQEIARGRLSPDLRVATIHGATTIGALVAQWQDSAHLSGEDLNLVRALHHTLRYQTLDAEFRALFAGLSEMQRAMLCYRFDPFAPLTLAQCAARLGRSPERTRMIGVEARDLLIAACGGHHFPRTRSIIHLAAAHIAAGGSLRDLADELTTRGLLQHRQRLDDLLIVWNATTLERPFPLDRIAAAREGLTQTQTALRTAIHPRADLLSRNVGALTLPWFANDADAADLRAALRSLGYTEIVSEWFWCDRAPHVGFTGVARKVFAVAGRVTPRELRAALVKYHGRQFPTPPTEIVRLVALRLRLATMDGDALKRGRWLDTKGALSDAERALYHFFQTNGPVVTFGELFEMSRAEGAVTRNLERTLGRSPIIRKVRQGMYALIGTPLTPQDIAAAAIRAQPTQPGGELRYNEDGTVTYRVPAGVWLLHSGVLNAPELRPFEGEWHTVDGRRVTIRSQRAWGFRRAIKALDLTIGEWIAVRLDTWGRTITVERCDS